MSTIYLVRHGQAGTRDAYDCLSQLGRRQSRLLGEHFLAQGIRFAVAYTGALTRQQQTAEEVSQAFARAGFPFPEVKIDAAWNEFDLARLYREIAPLLAAEDPAFKREYAEVCAQLREFAAAPEASVHRTWHPCDSRLVAAWAAGRFSGGGETWQEFCQRVVACRRSLASLALRENAVVFTSAVPVGLWAALSLGLSDLRVMRLAGVLYNSAYTLVRCQGEDLLLLALNSIPHLASPELCTRR